MNVESNNVLLMANTFQKSPGQKQNLLKNILSLERIHVCECIRKGCAALYMYAVNTCQAMEVQMENG